MIVKLKGKTQKGKNRIREWGETWKVTAKNESVLFSNERGPWASVIPIDIPTENQKSPVMGLRWINLRSDEDFEVEIVKE